MPTWNELYIQEDYQWKEPHHLVIQLASEWESQGSKHVLDLGCGAGRHMLYLAQRGHCVEGMDRAFNGLAIARQRLDTDGLNPSLTCGDMVWLPYADNCFDAVISLHVIFHNPLALMEQTLAEIWRVVKPGGDVWLTFNSTKSYRFGRGTRLEAGTYIPDVGGDAGIPHHFTDLPELAQILHHFDVRLIRLHQGGDEPQSRSFHWEVAMQKI